MIAIKNSPAGNINRYGVNFSREGNILVLREKFGADKELIWYSCFDMGY